MANSSPPLETLLESLKKNTETIASFIRMVVGWIREKKWVELISLILSAIIIAYLSRAAIAQFLGEQNSQWFVWICRLVALLFAVAVAVALLAKPKVSDTAANFVERKAIKGLRPFTQADQEIFSQLERQQDLKECLNALENTSFRFGYLIGESGTGKTSFLQAGLLPKLLEESSKTKGIYIKFSDQDPLKTIRRQLNLEKATEADFLSLLFQSVAAAGKPLILLFDQFEQFFCPL